jgi:recombinational DNA repair protein RecR
MLPLEILDVIDQFQKLPGVGKRGAQKLALDILELEKIKFQELQTNLTNMQSIVNCAIFALIHIETRTKFALLKKLQIY